MSYYGLRKVRVYKNEETGLYNISCEYYDSSVRDYKGNRIWDTCTKLLKEDTTKEDAEYYLFENTLDGNFHGTGGKYSCIEWGKNTVTLPKEQQEELDRLEKLQWDNPEKEEIQKLRDTEYKGLSYDEWVKVTENNPHIKALQETIKSYSRVYREVRYKYWYKAWKNYLEEKKQTGKVVIKVMSGYGEQYIKSLGTRTLKYCSRKENAKVFKDTKSVLLKKLEGFPISNIRFIDADIETEVLI